MLFSMKEELTLDQYQLMSATRPFPGRARPSDAQSAAKGLWLLPHTWGSSALLPSSLLPVLVAQTRSQSVHRLAANLSWSSSPPGFTGVLKSYHQPLIFNVFTGII